jgi:methionine-rich copper-binding protein CopC
MAAFRTLMIAAAATAALAATAPALAHPKLLSTTPAAGETAAAPTRIALAFSEALIAPMSGLDLTMTGMPGMAHHAPMKVTGFKTEVGADGKTLVATLPRALPAGSYDAHWHVVSVDTHRVEGHFAFTVR